jgi:hypothetical protein
MTVLPSSPTGDEFLHWLHSAGGCAESARCARDTCLLHVPKLCCNLCRDPSEYVRRAGRTARGATGHGTVSILVLGRQVGRISGFSKGLVTLAGASHTSHEHSEHPLPSAVDALYA